MAGPPGATPPDARIDLAALGPGSRDGSPSSRPSRSEPKGSTSFYVDYPEQPVAAEGGPLTFASAREQHGGLAGAAAALASRALAAWYGVLLMLAFFAVVLLLLGVFAFDPLPWEAWYTLAVTCTSLALLVFDALPIAITLLLCGVALNLSGVITDEQALVGFSNRGIASVAVLFVVADGVRRTSVLLPVFRVMLGQPKRLWEAQLRMLVPISLMSTFFFNTPLVVIFAPIVQTWSRRSGFPISRLLLPLNHAVQLGGTVTLLGASSNVVLKGLVDKAQILDLDGNVVKLTIFGMTKVAAIYMTVGLAYLVATAGFLIKVRDAGGAGAQAKNARQYTVPLRVTEKSPIVGGTVAGAGLRELQGLHLIEITRADGTIVPAVAPDTEIHARDTLLFAGVVETVTDLYTNIPGLVPATEESEKVTLERHHRRLVELVISSSSFLRGRTAREVRFRSRFNAAIIAVHRDGDYVKEEVEIADIQLHAGDTLLVETGAGFVKIYGRDSNFALVSEVSESQPPRASLPHMIISGSVVIGMVAIVTAGTLTLFQAACAAAVLMVLTRCVTVSNAIHSVNVEVVVAVASSFALAEAMEASGAARALALFLVNSLKGLGTVGLLFGIYFSGALLTSLLTNDAAVTLLWAIIRSVLVVEKGLNPYAAIYTLLLSISGSFTTPMGYNTNIIVHPLGGYTFTDWVVYGTPLVLLLAPVTVFSVNHFFPSP